MRSLDDVAIRIVFAVLLVLAASQVLAGCGPSPAVELGLELPGLEIAVRVPEWPEPEPMQAKPRVDHRASWCEPLDPPFCREQNDCPAGERCVRPWWAETDESKVCARPMPDRAERRWRADRLRVVVDYVCRRSSGCEPNDLHAYLRLLALRESTWRPWKRARLDPDREASELAWMRHRHRFVDNPAVGDPDRWTTGLGLYSQIPAIWLPRWDPLAPPEVLCGEVEATEAHLRAARVAVRKISNGIDCDGDGSREFFGSACSAGACRPSWYEASRVNSGSLCPGDVEHRRRFAARAERVGLDPWASVDAAALGDPIPRERQDEIAGQLRAQMESVELKRGR